jgi:hypothetical protein
MRAAIIAGLEAQATSLRPFTVSQELPWTAADLPLYVKNLRTLYVDLTDRSQDTGEVPQTLQGRTTVIETQTCRGYMACDAKNLPAKFDTAFTAMLEAIDTIALAPQTHRTASVTHEFDGDLAIFTFEWTTRELRIK